MLSAANTHDSMLFEPLLDTNPTVRGHHGRAGRPRCRPDKLHADKGYDYRRCRRYLTRRGIKTSFQKWWADPAAADGADSIGACPRLA